MVRTYIFLPYPNILGHISNYCRYVRPHLEFLFFCLLDLKWATEWLFKGKLWAVSRPFASGLCYGEVDKPRRVEPLRIMDCLSFMLRTPTLRQLKQRESIIKHWLLRSITLCLFRLTRSLPLGQIAFMFWPLADKNCLLI